MRKKGRLSNFLTLAFLVAFAWWGFNNRDVFEALKDVTIWALLAVAAGKIATNIANGFFTKWTVEAFTKRLSLAEGVYVAILSAIGNYFGPLLGGASIRAVHLKKSHGLSYSKFTSTVAGYYLIIFIANSILAIISILLLNESKQTAPLLIFFCVWLAVLVALTFVRLPKQSRWDRFTTKNKYAKYLVTVVYDIEEGWHILIKNKLLMLKLMLLGLSGFVITFCLTLVEFHAINVNVSLPALGLYTSLVTVSMLLSFTPGAIGIRETILIFVSVTLGVSNAEILQVAVIDRGVNFIVLLLLFSIIRVPGIKRKLAPDNAPI